MYKIMRASKKKYFFVKTMADETFS